MSYMRRNRNLGKRERAARKRHRRGQMCGPSTQGKWLKLGRKHSYRKLYKHLAVVDSRKSGE